MGVPDDIAEALAAVSARSPGATEQLIEIVRGDLRRQAVYQLRQAPAQETLEPTALIHEAYIRLFGKEDQPTWNNRGHFFMAAGRVMHDILVERARYATRKKRGGGTKPVSLEDASPALIEASRFLELHESLDRLAELAPERAEIVRLRFYCDITYKEIAALLGLSERTIRREWGIAKVWLQNQLGADQVVLPDIPQP